MTKKKEIAPKILGIITARGGSKGLPGKNIKLLGGKPLIVWSIEAGKASKFITNLIVSTDDLEIAEIARRYGGEVPFIRPKELALDTTPHLPVVRHAIEFMEKVIKIAFDYVVILQPTSPFRKPQDIDETIKVLIKENADSAVSITTVEPREHPIKIKKLEGNLVLPFSISEPEGIRKQDLPLVYKRSSAVYAMKRDLVMKESKIFGTKIAGHVVPQDRYIDIDTHFDWLKAEYLLEELRKKGEFLN